MVLRLQAWLGGRSISDVSLAELADALERKHVEANKSDKKACEALLSLGGASSPLAGHEEVIECCQSSTDCSPP